MDQAEPPPRSRILIVDDDPLVNRTMRRLLDDSYVVDVELDANDALARITAGETFDAVLCDLMMPTLSGAEFGARLAEIAPAMRAACGFVTGGACGREAEAFVATLPRDRVLIKPFAVADLLALVERLLATRAS